MYEQIPDFLIETIQIGWDDSRHPSRPCTTPLPGKARVICDFISTPYWESHVKFFFSGVLEHTGRISNDSGFLFDKNIEPGDEPFTGVQLFDPLDAITLSDHAFDKLMSRYFRVLIDHAVLKQLEVIQEPWWSNFVDATIQIEQRLKATSI